MSLHLVQVLGERLARLQFLKAPELVPEPESVALLSVDLDLVSAVRAKMKQQEIMLVVNYQF